MAEANPRTFDLFAPTEAIKQAEAIVPLVRDRNSLFQLSKLEKKINSTANPDEVATLEEKRTALQEKVDKSKLRVHLQGVDKVGLDAIQEALETENKADENGVKPFTEEQQDLKFHLKVLETMIVKIEDAEGAVAAHPGDRTGEWYSHQPPENRAALNIAVQELTFKAYEYDANTVNPDF